MKLLFNTRNREAVASAAYSKAFSTLANIDFYTWDSYGDYDVVFFMPYEKDLPDIKTARLENPTIKIGLIDPRGTIQPDIIRDVDFIIIDSLEMRDFFAKYQKPIFTYFEYTNLEKTVKKHSPKNKLIIGYHGNKVHLMEMVPRITDALELLSTKYELELWAMYNIEKLGMWEFGATENLPVRHIQWSLENYYTYLAQADIGIVPALMPVNDIAKMKKKTTVCKSIFLDDHDDYLVKFKMPSNPGRIITFAQLGIPVVADMSPSSMQMIRDGENGFIAYSTGGWYCALEKLIIRCELRQTMSEAMQTSVSERYDYDSQNRNLQAFLDEIVNTPQSPPLKIIENSDHRVGKALSYKKEILQCLVSTTRSRLKRKIKKLSS